MAYRGISVNIFFYKLITERLLYIDRTYTGA